MKLPHLLLTALAATPAFAQTTPPLSGDPGAIQQMRINEEERRRQIERLERQQAGEPIKDLTPATPAVRTDLGGQRFLVREIRFTKSEIFTPEELKAFAGELEGKEVTLAELQALAAKINEAYRSRHIVTAQAVIPPQNVSSGIVEIRLIEGRVGKINIEGNNSTRREYIIGRLGQGPGDLVNLPGLEKDLEIFNRTNDVQLRLVLAPGSVFGTTDFRIEAVEPQRHDLRLFIDNNGSASTGKWRGGLMYFNHSLFGYRDELSLSTTQASGQESYSIGYSLPVNNMGGRVSLNFYQDYTKILHGSYASLNLTGESTSGVLSLRQPVYFDKTSQFNLLASTKQRRTTNWAGDERLQRTDSFDGSLGAEFQKADGSGFWFATYSYTAGEAENPASKNYEVGRGSILRNQNLSGDWSLRGSFNFQHTPTNILPSSEQMIIGGEGSVRGYQVGTYSGESGYGASLELNHPLGTLGKLDSATAIAAKGFFFLDYARVSPYRPGGSVLPKNQELGSLGWGVNSTIGKNLNARLTLAYALNDVPLQPNSHYYVHFQLIASLF